MNIYRYFIKHIIIIILLVAYTLSISSCSKRNEAISDSFWYSCSSFKVPSVEGYSQSVCANIYSDGYYYLTVFGRKIDDAIDGAENYYQLYKIDSEGNGCSAISLPVKCASASHQTIINNKLYCINQSSNTEYVIDINKGNIISENRSEDTVIGFFPIEDGYVKMTSSCIIRYSGNNNETGHIDIDNTDNIRSFYQKDGKYYLIQDNYNLFIFYELDFSNNQLVKVLEINVNCFFGFELNEGMFFSDNGVYFFDIKSKTFMPITEWNYVDIQPAYKKTRYEINIAYDNERFGKLYAYSDNEIELIIFNNIPAELYSNREPITIGGYGVESSLAIKWAAYKFNTSQNKYRIYLDDYWNDYSYTSGVEAQSQIVKLMKHFNDGNAPDIYYGTNFDYGYMYNAGMVMDMLPMMENDPDFNINDLVPSIAYTITKNGVCYQIFSAFYFDGDFGLQSSFEDDNVTYTEIDAISQSSGVSVRGDMPAAEFADQIIRYSLGDLIDKAPDSHILSTEELRRIIDYSVRNGIPYGSYSNNIADFDTIHDGSSLTCRRTHLGNLYELFSIEQRLNDSFVYLGFPSVYGSVHAVQPDGLVAISSDSKKQDACWQFIKYLLSYEIQEIEIGQGNNPVVNKVFENYCQFAKNPELVSESDVVWNSIINGKDAVPEWIINDYKSMVNSIDSVISYDWGLYNIICEEINSFYIQGKSIDSIAETLQSRIDLYVAENYI